MSFEQNGSGAGADQRGLLSTIDLLAMSWRRKVAIGSGLLLGLVLGAAYYTVTPTTYESEAEVLIVAKRPQAMTRDEQYESGFEDFIAVHSALIISPLIVNRAIEMGDLRSLETFADSDPDGDLAETIIGGLEAGSGPRDLGDNANSIMKLSFQGAVADECPLVVQAIVDSYQMFLDETYRSMSDDVMQLIGQASSLLENDLQEQEDEYVEFRQKSPLVTRGADEVNPLQERLAAIEVQRSELLLRRAEVEGQLRAIEKASQNRLDDQQLVALIADLRQQSRNTDGSASATSAALDNQLIQLTDREQQLLELYGPSHPHVVTVRERIESIRKLQSLPTLVHVSVTPDRKLSSAENAELYTRFLEQELDRIEVSEQLLTELYEREHAVAKELAGFQLKDERFQRDITRTQQLYDEVISQLQGVSLAKGIGGFEARVIATPGPGKKAGPSLKIIGAGAVFLGLCFGCGLALIGELTDKRVHSRQELQARFGWPLLGAVPQFNAENGDAAGAAAGGASLSPLLCSELEPMSAQSEAIRAVRTATFCSRRDQDRGVIQLVGASPGDGATTLIANLAISLAHQGRRVLLMDADLREPRHHELFGAAGDPGLCSVLAGGVSLDDAVRSTTVDNLSLLPVGPVPSDAFELVASEKFSEMLAALREGFDCVLVDAGPLLAGAHAGAIATQTDGVVLAVRPTYDSRERADRAKEILDTLAAKVIGVVVNGIGAADTRGYH